MKRIVFAGLLAAANYGTVNAQTPFSTIDSVNINKIHASVTVHGDMWGDPNNYSNPHCTFPNGTHKSIGGPSALWMSGYDGGGQLHVAAQTYRQNGNDYWPGPLDASDTLTYHTSHDWAKIWKINRSDIQYFLGLSDHTLTNTPPMILTWPGKGSSHARGNGGVALTVVTDMAPFVDINGNGIYEPLAGDYPDIKGDQALWWVFSDNGPAHTETNGRPLKVEVHAMSYAYSRGTLIDNVVYCDYTIINRSANNYSNFRAGLEADIDLGYSLDDYIGFDSTWRLGIQYNATADDGAAGGHPAVAFGLSIPVAGVTLVSLPGDVGTNYVPAGNFTYYNNDGSVIGNPGIDTQYNHYLRGRTRSGQNFRNDFAGAGINSSGIGAGPVTKYVFTGDPSNPDAWSECAAANAYGDRRFVLSSNDLTLAAGSSTHIVVALVTTDTGRHNGCGAPGFSFAGIKEVADTAWKVYQNPPPPITSSIAEAYVNNISVYPNPVSDVLHVTVDKVYGLSDLHIFNLLGQEMRTAFSLKGTESIADVSSLSPGVYCVYYNTGDRAMRSVFVKQ